MTRWTAAAAAAIACLGLAAPAGAATVVLYDQDFETPNDPPDFDNGAGSGYRDLSQQQVNDLYGSQPAGFTFAQDWTVETMLLTGTQAFGTGYSDPSGIGGDYAVGMLSNVQNDLLGLSFDAGAFPFFNFRLDVSSMGLDGPGGPFTNASLVPKFRFTLYDNPTGATGLFGNGTVLDTADLTGTASAIDTTDWTSGQFAFDLSNATNGKVTLQIDLLEGGYAIFDNFRITASDEQGGGLDPVPLPAGLPLLLAGLGAIALLRRRG